MNDSLAKSINAIKQNVQKTHEIKLICNSIHLYRAAKFSVASIPIIREISFEYKHNCYE